MINNDSAPKDVEPARAGAPPDDQASTHPRSLDATENVVSDEPVAPKKHAAQKRRKRGHRHSASLEPDPESFADVAQGNFLVKLAAGLLIVLAVFGLILALT